MNEKLDRKSCFLPSLPYPFFIEHICQIASKKPQLFDKR
jgi:hypothetical protein